MVNSNLENVVGLTRGAGLSSGATSVTGGWGATSWETTYAAGLADESVIYFGFKPKPGFAMSLQNIDPFSYKRSGTGPAEGIIDFTVNGGTSYSGVSQGPFYFGNSSAGGAGVTPTRILSYDSELQQTSNAVGFRIVPYNATDPAGEFFIYNIISSGDDFTINGSILGSETLALSGFESIVGFASNVETFVLKGDGLTASNVVLTAPTGYEISGDNSVFNSSLSITPSSGVINSTVYVRLSDVATVGSHTGDLTIIGGGFTALADLKVALSGVVKPYPVVNVTQSTSFLTIQAAIDDAATVNGDVITVAAGTYAITSTINVNKEVTINGPQFNIDPRSAAGIRTSGSTNEAIIDGGGNISTIFNITAARVVLNGLEVTNGTGDLISSSSSPVKTDMGVKYCIVHGSSGDEGIQLRNTDGGEISYNRVYNIAGDGINLSDGSTNSSINNNEIYESASDNGVIYLYDNGPFITVENNLLYNNTSDNGIQVGNKSGSNFNSNSAFGNNAIISGNTVTGHIGSNVGIYVNTSRVNVQNNIVNNWESNADAAVYLRWNIKDVSVTGNTISNNNRAIKVSSGVGLVNAATLAINQNSIFDNTFGMLNSSSGVVDARENWWGDNTGPSGEGTGLGNSVSANVVFCPFLDDVAGVGVAKDCPVKNVDTGESFVTIQSAIDDADTDNGDVITVLAGTYEENIVVNKELEIRGPNFGTSPNTETRVAEAFLVPSISDEQGSIVSIQASNVKIDGLTFNGDNSSLSSGWTGTNGADIDAGSAVVVYASNINNLIVSNNIIENVGYFGVFLYGAAPAEANTSKTGNEISDNLIRDLGHYNTGNGVDNWGGGMYLGNSHYTNVKNNVITNVRIGIQTGNFQTSHVGASQYQVIEGNTIETRYLGIFFNLHRYSPWTITNNTIKGIDNPIQAGLTTRPWRGILLASLGNNMGTSIVSNNTIDGSAITSYTSGKEGINVWNVKSDGFATITGGSITGVETGIFLNNYDGYASNAADGAYATISGVEITATGTGIRLLDNPAATSHAAVQATLGAGIIVNGGTDGLTIENASAQVISPTGDITFNTQTGDYVKLIANTNDVDMSAASFEGKKGTTATLAENFAIEDKITHEMDNASLGSVSVKGTEWFVTTNSGSIQRAIELSSNGDKINVNDGTYNEDISITKEVSLKSATGSANTTISGVAATRAIDIAADNVTVEGFTVSNNGRQYGIYANNKGGLNIKDNHVTDVGVNTLVSTAVYGIVVEATANAVDHINITGNTVDDINGGNKGSIGAIAVGFSTGDYDLTNLTIDNNTITDIDATTAAWPEGRGAYGILINLGSSVGGIGKVVSPVITNNNITDLEGLWATGIGLEGDTPGAMVTGNSISDLTDHKGPSVPDASGVKIESNDGAATVVINNNDFFNIGSGTTNDGFGVNNFTTTLVNADNNYWGATDGPSGTGIGTGVKASENVSFCPFLDGVVGSGAPIGCPVKNVETGKSYVTIQAAINDVLTVNGNTIEVASGTYTENVVVNKSLTINGPNAGISPNTGTRTDEAIVVPATVGSDAIFIIEASDVTINGFKLDGDNTNLTSGWLGTNGADIDTYDGVVYFDAANSLVVNKLIFENNIVQNIQYFGVDLFGWGNYNNPSTTGHRISDNLFKDLGTYDASNGYDKWGGGVLLYNDNYANVVNNTMDNVRNGIQTGNFHDANPGAPIYQLIENNTIKTRRLGIFFNLHTGASVAPMTVSNNTITAIANANELKWNGMLLSSLSNSIGTVNDNTINGAGTDPATLTVNGIEVWNVKSDAPVAISGGTIDNVNTGIFLNNFDGYSSNAGDGAHATISGITITPHATGTGIRLLDNPSSTHAAVQATLGAGIIVNGGTDGLTIENASAQVISPTGDITFNTQTGDYVKLIANTNDVDMSAASFDGKTGATASKVENFDIEDKVSHKVDDATLGLVRVKSKELFVTTNSGNIQRAINAASASDVVNVNDGIYTENLILDKKLTLSGMGDNTIIQGGTGNGVTYLDLGSGLGANDRSALTDLRLKGFVTGVYAANQVDFVKLENVNFDANTSYGVNFNNTSGVLSDWVIDNSKFDGSSVGIKVASKGGVNGLKVVNSIFSNNSSEAIHASQDKNIPGTLTNVELTNNNFTLNGHSNNKSAIYAEKLDHALIKGNTFTNNGTSTNARGMIINLKYDDYSNIAVSENILNETRGGTLAGGYAVSIAARNDGSSYSPFPASLATVDVSKNEINGFYIGVGIDNNVDWNTSLVTNNKILNSEAAISASGAPAGLSLDIHQNDFSGSTYALFNSVTGSSFEATCNWFDSIDPLVVDSKVSGDVNFLPFGVNGTDYDLITTGFQPVPGSCNGVGPVRLYTDNSFATLVNSFFSIQDAVDAASSGNGIEVASGTYSESVNVNKSLTFKGPNAEISPNTGSRVAEAVLVNLSSGRAFTISTGNTDVTISGFKFDGGSPIHDGNDTGNPMTSNVTFSKNVVINSNAIYAGTSTSWRELEITDNKFENVNASATASAMQVSHTSSTSITDNTFNNINYAAMVIDATPTVNISGNTIDGTGYQGIQIAGAVGDVTIERNKISNANRVAQAVDRGAIRMYGSGFTGAVTITNNEITGGYNGIAVKDGENITGKNIRITENSITGLVGGKAIYHGGIGELSSTCNWFDTTDPELINAQISGDVTFLPFLTNGTDDVLNTIGFQPVAGSCDGFGPVKLYTDNSLSTILSSHFKIQDAIDEASNGNAIVADAGMYIENLTMSKSITLLGANNSISPNTGTRVSETIIMPSAGAAITGTTSDITVTVKGFTFDQANSQGTSGHFMSQVSKTGTNWTFENNIFQNAGDSPTNGNWKITGTSTGLKFTLKDNFIRNNAASNGISIWDNPDFEIDVQNNVWEDNGAHAFNISGAQGIIKGNVFRDTRSIDLNSSSYVWYDYQGGILMSDPGFDLDIIENEFINVQSGIVLYADVAGPINIKNNLFDGSHVASIRASNSEAVNGSNLNDLVVTNNSFINYAGVGQNISNSRADNALLTTTCNWFGVTADTDISALLSVNVLYPTWLTDGIDASPAVTGFQPLPNSCFGSEIVIVSAVSSPLTCETMGSLTVTFSGGNGPYDVAWTDGGTNTGSTTNVTSPYTISNLPAAAYSITVGDANGSTKTQGGVNVTLFPIPLAPTIIADNSEICKGGNAVLSGSCSSSTEIFRWTTPSMNQSNAATTLTSSGTQVVTTPGTYSGYCESSDGCIGPNGEMIIIEGTNCNGQKFLTVTPELPYICPGSSISVSASGCESGIVSWTSPAGTETGSTVSLSPSITTNYVVSCSTGGSTTVEVKVAQSNVVINSDITTGKSYVKAVNTINTNRRVGSPNFTPSPNVLYEAGNSIVLTPGFIADEGSVFKAEIKGCD
ncbi:MAG: right-handed parallel beta-helix repeat-containing protein [Cytophagales bacterium]|nr:right-handed parallel beta-helix repeat-containing protein [Cytophagales bacterium]